MRASGLLKRHVRRPAASRHDQLWRVRPCRAVMSCRDDTERCPRVSIRHVHGFLFAARAWSRPLKPYTRHLRLDVRLLRHGTGGEIVDSPAPPSWNVRTDRPLPISGTIAPPG